MRRRRHALPSKVVARIMPRIEPLAAAPVLWAAKNSKAAIKEWRIRIGDYRVAYEIDDKAITVDVTRAAHRREVYEWANSLPRLRFDPLLKRHDAPKSIQRRRRGRAPCVHA
jgi:mRNA interferase RelE/StbE